MTLTQPATAPPGTGAHRSILQGMLAVGVFAIVGKVAGAAKEMAVAWRYGVSPEIDAYLFVFNLVSWPVAVWAGVLAVTLIPMEARIREESPAGLRHFRAELLGATLLVGLALSLIARLALPPLLQSGFLGLPPRTVELALRMVPALAWLTVPGLLVGLYSTWMMSGGRHANTLLEGVPALGILLAVLLVGGIEPLVWGTLAGTVVQLGLVARASGAGDTGHRPAFGLASAHWRPFWSGFGIMMLGQAVMTFATLVDQFFAARLGEGAISSIGYANRLIALALGILATAVTRATLPVFARSAAEGGEVRALALRWAGGMALVGVAVVAVGWVLGPWAVRLVYERGTFTATDTDVVARLLRLGLLQLPPYVASLVLVSLHSSLGHYRLLLASGVLGLSVKALASWLLLPGFGAGALMLSAAVVYAANTVLLMRRIPR
ncbi:MAG TPA: lipid II flippase MurJ [Gemmatimonadales bacterium]|nr:lipid II flippase MurJ [Gemmatimonadales bacterium]